MNKSGVLIFSYTRQAIADGVLVDVSKLAKEAGFRFPVAVTAGVWAECVTVPEGVAGQDETGRLWDVLNVLRFAIANKVACPATPSPGRTSTANGSISRCMSERTTARETRRSFPSMPFVGQATTASRS